MKLSSFMFFLLLSSTSIAYGKITNTPSQHQSADTLTKYYLFAELQTLHSTHNNYFTGISAGFNKTLSKRLTLGAGVEYSYSPLHHDNGWVLRNLKFLPIYMDSRLRLLKSNRIASPFIQLSTGMSFVNYSKRDNDTYGNSYHVSEQGLYTYLGTGIYFNVGKHIRPYVALGFKGFHMSLNVWEVNPHGVCYKIGVRF